MADIFHKKFWESEVDNIVFKTDKKKQDIIIDQLKIELRAIYKKDEKLTTNFEFVLFEDVINRAHLDEKMIKNRCSDLIYRKKLQRIYITQQRRSSNWKSSKNDYTYM